MVLQRPRAAPAAAALSALRVPKFFLRSSGACAWQVGLALRCLMGTKFQGRFPPDLALRGLPTAPPVRLDFAGQSCDPQTRAPSGLPLVLLPRARSCALPVALLLVPAEVTGGDGWHGLRAGHLPFSLWEVQSFSPAQHLQTQTHSLCWPSAGWACGSGAGAADCLDPSGAVGCR